MTSHSKNNRKEEEIRMESKSFKLRPEYHYYSDILKEDTGEPYANHEIIDLLYNQQKEIEELKKESQYLEDKINDIFHEHELELSSEIKSQAHLELGVEFAYEY